MRAFSKAFQAEDEVLLQRAIKLLYILSESLFAAPMRELDNQICFEGLLSQTQTLKERFSRAQKCEFHELFTACRNEHKVFRANSRMSSKEKEQCAKFISKDRMQDLLQDVVLYYSIQLFYD